MEPEMMLFDEPTSALDPEMIKEVLDVMTMLCVTHEIAFVRKIVSQIIFMEAGCIVEANIPDNFFENPKEERTQQ